MGSLRRKIDSLTQDIKHMTTWGISLGLSRLFLDLFVAEVRDKSEFLKKVAANRQKKIHKVIEKYYPKEVIREPNDDINISIDCPIWIFWWQGFTNAPEIVKLCVESIKRNRGHHQVLLIDKDNYQEYVELPNYVIEKYKSGKISTTHFSDILRFALLYEQGGVWMDATIYLEKEFDDEVYKYPLYTIRFSQPSERKWTSFFWASCKRNTGIGKIRDFYYNYWEHESGIIDYFLINAIISIVYDSDSSFRNQLNILPESNSNVMKMFENLNNANEMLQIDKGTYINKLSYKRNWKGYTKTGELTVYGALVKAYRDNKSVTRY